VSHRNKPHIRKGLVVGKHIRGERAWLFSRDMQGRVRLKNYVKGGEIEKRTGVIGLPSGVQSLITRIRIHNTKSEKEKGWPKKDAEKFADNHVTPKPRCPNTGKRKIQIPVEENMCRKWPKKAAVKNARRMKHSRKEGIDGGIDAN